jgi:predicted P-loop ATPase
MIETAALMVARENKRHPFREYLQTRKWDGTPRLATWLQDCCDAENSAFAQEAGKRILIAAVARTFKPGCPSRWALILKGPQNKGKSGIPEVLFGPEQWGDLERHMVQNKDGQILFVTAACIRHDELAALTSAAESEHLKSFISKTSAMFRPPYDKSMKSFPARCVHIGSTNDDKFLRHDPTGNNRWVVVNVSIADKKFDFPQLYQIRDQLWAEAVHLYRQGHPYETVPDADIEARKYEQHNLYTDALERLFAGGGAGELLPLPSDPNVVYTSLAQVCQALQISITGANMVVQKNIGAALKELGFSKKDRPRGTGVTTAWCMPAAKYKELCKKAAVVTLPASL